MPIRAPTPPETPAIDRYWNGLGNAGPAGRSPAPASAAARHRRRGGGSRKREGKRLGLGLGLEEKKRELGFEANIQRKSVNGEVKISLNERKTEETR